MNRPGYIRTAGGHWITLVALIKNLLCIKIFGRPCYLRGLLLGECQNFTIEVSDYSAQAMHGI